MPNFGIRNWAEKAESLYRNGYSADAEGGRRGRFTGVGQRHSKRYLARICFKMWSYIGNFRHQDSRQHKIYSRSNRKSRLILFVQ